MVALLRRQPLLLPLLVLAIALATWAWRTEAADSPPSSIVTIEPARIVDTRDGTDLGIDGPVRNGESERIRVTGVIETSTGDRTVVPIGSTGVLLNVTAIRPTAAGFLSLRPGTASGPSETSNVNFQAGQIVPNSVTVAVPTSGADAGIIDLRHGGPTVGSQLEVVIDVVGYMVGNEPAGGVQLASADQPEGDEVSTLDDGETDHVVVTLAFDAPVAGQLLVSGSVTVSDMEPDAFVACGISDDGANPADAAWESAGTDGSIGHVAPTRLLDVDAGVTTVELLCDSFRADDGSPAFLNGGRLTAIFTPS